MSRMKLEPVNHFALAALSRQRSREEDAPRVDGLIQSRFGDRVVGSCEGRQVVIEGEELGRLLKILGYHRPPVESSTHSSKAT